MPEYKPKTPAVVDISKVDGSPYPRKIGFSTDKSRYKKSKQTMGDPLINYEGKSNPYIDYQSIDLLLSLQNPRSEGYDEMCFYVMGQVKEILFKGLHFELFNAREQIKLDEINNAITILERSIEYVKFIADAWNILSTIKPEGFNQFRDYLGTASGQLSFMYRHVEFILGNKSEKMASAHKNVPHVWPEIKKNLETPSLYDEVIFYLNRKGLSISEAVLGVSKDIDTVTGKVRIKLEAGIQSGKILRLRGKGLKSINGYGNGDLLVHVNVWTPKTLSKEQKSFFEQMKNDEHFKPSPDKNDKSFFEKVKDMFS